MKQLFRSVIVLALTSFFPLMARAELMPEVPGTEQHFFSDNGRYEITITCEKQGHSWSFSEKGKELWKQPLFDEPGEAAVSDNGETIILPLWGWRDEGGSSGIAVYDKKGELRKKIPFAGEHPDETVLRWVRYHAISPDGSSIAIGLNGIGQAEITLFDASTGALVWGKNTGYPVIVQIRVAQNGKFTLAATRNETDGSMAFILFDRMGKEIWQKKTVRNFSRDVSSYVQFRSGRQEFGVFDRKTGRYIFAKLPATAN